MWEERICPAILNSLDAKSMIHRQLFQREMSRVTRKQQICGTGNRIFGRYMDAIERSRKRCIDSEELSVEVML